MAKEKDPLLEAALAVAFGGVDHNGTAAVNKYLDGLPTPLVEAGRRLDHTDDVEAPAPLLDFLAAAFTLRYQNASVITKGNLIEVAEGGHWATAMPAESLYLLVPETRAFAKKVAPAIQVETIETASRLGHVTDLRLLQIYLKHLEDKKEVAPIADAIVRDAIPAFGAQILVDLWPSLSPDNRTFTAASKIDIQATLKRLTEKNPDKKAKGADKQSQVTKACEKILEDEAAGGEVGPESLPTLKLALKYAPEPAFRRKVAEALAKMGTLAQDALPDLIDAFERTGFTRDYNLIRPLMVLGKESNEVCDSLIRALDDRDSTVRLMSAFNLGQMGEPAIKAIRSLEDHSERDPDTKVRDQALKTLNKLRARLEPVELVGVEITE